MGRGAVIRPSWLAVSKRGLTLKKLVPFSEWPVQSGALRDLYDRLCEDAVPHAMLFTGHPAQTEQVTKYLAKLLLCTAETAPCGVCAACAAVELAQHPDLHVLDEDGAAGVKTGAVASLQGQLALRSHTGGRTVYVIHSMDTATPAAANRLLKTLEEPQGPLVAMLTAVNARRVLPTIRSRCFQYALDTGNLWADANALGLSTFLQAGSDGEEDSIAAEVGPMIQWIQKCLSHAVPSLQLADLFMKSAGSLAVTDALQFVSVWLRDVMHVQLGQSAYIQFLDYQAELHRHAQLATVVQIARVIELVQDARVRLQSHVVPLLNLEQMCIRVERGLADV